MKNDFIIHSTTKEEVSFIYKMVREYNEKNNLFMRDGEVENTCKVIKDSEGNIIAGISGQISHNFKSLDISVLWVKEEFRKCGYGTLLLENVEKEAFEKGIALVYLGTLGFQAKDFYIKKGYEVFAVLDEAALNNKVYFVKKILNNKVTALKDTVMIETGGYDEMHYIDDNIVKFNSQKVPFTHEPAFEDVNKIIKDSQGNIIAGICTTILPWTDLEIKGIWSNENNEEEELKYKLLNEVENELKIRSGHVAFHETFNVKIVDFLIKNGYKVYGILEDYPLGCKSYYLKKIL